MLRRAFLTLTAAAAFMAPQIATAADMVDYKPGLIDQALADGKTVLVDYSAKWCGTCKRQGRVINELRAENPDYDAKMIFVKVDWDTYKEHEVTQFRNIPRRSTLLVLRGEDELGRIVAGTGKAEIKALMDKGLNVGS